MLQKNWITVKEAAERIGCTVQHVRHLVRNEQIEGNKITERMVVVHAPSVEKYCNLTKTVGRPRISEKDSNPS